MTNDYFSVYNQALDRKDRKKTHVKNTAAQSAEQILMNIDVHHSFNGGIEITVQPLLHGVKVIFSNKKRQGDNGSRFHINLTDEQAVTLADNLILKESREQESIYQKRNAG